MATDAIDKLAWTLLNHGPALVLTGAGCSTRSGIPAYRDENGDWKHSRPVMFDEFMRDAGARRRYWARSMNGWQRVAEAQPNAGHRSLARLETAGLVHTLVTQNVDGLHRRAGSRNVIDLHGNLEEVLCMECADRIPRETVQAELLRHNRAYLRAATAVAPDGDAQLDDPDFSSFRVPACGRCGGLLKPDVVFFGESIPADRLATCMEALDAAGCLLVAGSSLMVFSGYRYCREAARRGLPLLAINRGRTRADDMLDIKIEDDCGTVLSALEERLRQAA